MEMSFYARRFVTRDVEYVTAFLAIYNLRIINKVPISGYISINISAPESHRRYKETVLPEMKFLE